MDHRNSITNRIEQLRKNLEKNKEGNQDNQEATTRNRFNFVGRSSVYDRVKFIESQLEKCESDRKEKNFSKLTEKFGIDGDNFNNENKTSDKNKETKPSVDELRHNIDTEDLDFQTRKRRFETAKKNPVQGQSGNPIFKSNEQALDFLSQAKAMCEDYEREITLLRNKLKESGKFSNLKITESNEENNFNIVCCASNYFVRKLEEISKEASPDFNMLNSVYSDKITELFLENEKLENKMKEFTSQDGKIKELEKKIDDLLFKVKDKEIYIDNMNEIYAKKFTEVFNENDTFKKQLEGKENQLEILKNEIKTKTQELEEFKLNQLHEITALEEEKNQVSNNLEEKEKEIRLLKEDLDKEKIFHSENYNAHKKQIEDLDSIKGNLEKEIEQLKELFDLKKKESEELRILYSNLNDTYEKCLEEKKNLYKEIEDSKNNFNRLISAKEEIIENFEKKFSEKEEIYIKEEISLKDKIEELEEKMVQKDIMLNQLKLELEQSTKEFNEIKSEKTNGGEDLNPLNNKNTLSNENNNSEKIEGSNENVKSNNDALEILRVEFLSKEFELNQKILSLSSENSKLTQVLTNKERKENELTEDISALEKEIEKIKKKLKEATEETDNLREIIAKDQLRIKELKEFKEKALEGKIDLNFIPTENNENQNIKNSENQESVKISEYNILLDKLKDEKSKSKVLCDEYRKLQENVSSLKLENSKKEKVIEANIKMIEELKVRLRNKIKLDEIIIQNKNKDSPNLNNIGICYNCNNQINNINNNNFRSFSITSAHPPNIEFQRGRSQSNINPHDNNSNPPNRDSFVSTNNTSNSTIHLSEENINSNSQGTHSTNNNVSNVTSSVSNEGNMVKINENKIDGKIRVTFEQFSFCKLLIVENLLLNYQLSQSISLNFIIDVLLKNFNFLFNTTFIDENNTDNQNEKLNILKETLKSTNSLNNNYRNKVFGSSTGSGPSVSTNEQKTNKVFGSTHISLFHEFLEDVILKIYDIASQDKNNQDKTPNKNIENNKDEVVKTANKENNISGFGKTIANLFSSKNSNQLKNSDVIEVWNRISKDDFNFELINKITSEISENNILLNLIYAQRTSKPSIQELFNGFKLKFEKFFDYEFLNISDKNTKYYEVVNIKLEEYLNKEIKSVLIENLKNFSLNSKNKISLLIDKISQNFQDGLLLNSMNKTPIYYFKDFDKEYSEFNFILRNSRNVNSEEDSLIPNVEEEKFTNENSLPISDLIRSNNSLKTTIPETLRCPNKDIKNTLIINLSDADKILRHRHTFDYFRFLIKSLNSDLKRIIIKGDIKKNVDLKNFYSLFLNIILYNKNITRLNFTDVYLSCDTQIRENESLRRLSIYKEPVNQSLLELVNFLNFSTNIRYLNISNCFIGDEGLKYLCKNFYNYNLIELNLTKNHLKENSGFYLADFIPKLYNLESLILADNSITDPGFTSLATAISHMSQSSHKYALRSIDFSNNSLTENESRSFVDYLQKYQNLKYINFSGNALNSQAANSIGIYMKLAKEINTIDLSKCELNEEACPLLIKNLDSSVVENIILDSNPLGQIGAILIANMLRINKNIKYISLKDCGITAMGITLLAKNCENNTSLKEINLKNNPVNHEEYKILNKILEGKSYTFLLDENKII